MTKVPGLLGIDHIGITVPDVDAAAAWFEDVLGFTNPLTFGPFADPVGDFMHAARRRRPEGGRRADQDGARRQRPRRRAVPVHGARPGSHVPQELRLGRPPHRLLRPPHRQGRRVHAGARASQKLLGPFPVTAGPAAGQTINYFQTPFGTYVELISYPHGMAYEATARSRSGTRATTTPRRGMGRRLRRGDRSDAPTGLPRSDS